MNHDLLVDLYSPQYWVIVALGVLFVLPWRTARAKAWAFAAVNLSFLSLLLERSLILLLPALLVVGLVVRSVRGRAGALLLFLGAVALAFLFALHKRPDLARALSATKVTTLLSAVGFSYAMLRVVDMARAVREGKHAPPSAPQLINYVLPFHMLSAGPIQSYDAFVKQVPESTRLTARAALEAFESIATGLFKKYVAAQLVQNMLLTDFRAGFAYGLLELQLSYIWLYLDFSAYSQVALGVGKLLGVATPVNFNRPYLARNPVEFWERWHISLSEFIRAHVFYPIQLTLMRRADGRHKLLIASFALAVAFSLCAVWHSLSLPWLYWGVLQVSGVVACNWYKQYLSNKLGRRGVQQYLEKRWLRWLAVVATFQFEALACYVVMRAP